MYALVNTLTNEVVSTFNGTPGTMRVEIPDGTNRIIMGATVGAEAAPFKVVEIQETTAGSGPIAGNPATPTFDGTTCTRVTTLRLKNKTETLIALAATTKTKLGLGWVYNTKTYQCDDTPLPQGSSYLSNMNRFLNAYIYFTVTKPAWATLTVYGLGDIVIQAKVFYKCTEAHTAGVFATDLAAGKWAVWYFHPFKGGNGKWRDKDDGMNALTTEQAREMCEGAVNYHMAVLAQAVVHKDAIKALATDADVLTYATNTMPTGWPANT